MKTSSGLLLTLLSIGLPLLTALAGDNLLEKLGLVEQGDKTTIWLAVSVVTTLVAVPVLLSLWTRPRLGSGASVAYGAAFIIVLIGTIWDVTTTTLGLAYTLTPPAGMTEAIAISIGVFLLIMYLTLAILPQFLRGSAYRWLWSNTSTAFAILSCLGYYVAAIFLLFFDGFYTFKGTKNLLVKEGVQLPSEFAEGTILLVTITVFTTICPVILAIMTQMKSPRSTAEVPTDNASLSPESGSTVTASPP